MCRTNPLTVVRWTVTKSRCLEVRSDGFATWNSLYIGSLRYMPALRCATTFEIAKV